MKFATFAAAAAMMLAAPHFGFADVGVEDRESVAPPVTRRPYIERYVEPAPAYREEVRIYRTVPEYETRVYREVPVYREAPIYREVPAPIYRERSVCIVPPRVHHFGPRIVFGW